MSTSLNPFKSLAVILACVFAVSVVACSDDEDDGKEACDALAVKCAGQTPACDAARIQNSSKADAVEDCIENAADCNAAQACLQGI